MTTIKDLKAKHAAELAAEEKRAAIASALPVEPKHVCIHPDHVSAKYAKAYPNRYTFAEALALIDTLAMEPVTCEHWKDSCISCRPLAINSTAKSEGATLQGTSAFELTLNAGKGYDGHELSFWAMVAGQLCEIGIELQPRWKWMPQTKFRYNSHGDVTENKVSPMGIGEDILRRFWSPPGSYRLSYYWADIHNFKAWASHEIDAEKAQRKGTN